MGSDILSFEYPDLFNHFPTVGHLDCFPFVAISWPGAVMKAHIHKPLGTFLIIPWESLCRREAAHGPCGHVFEGRNIPLQNLMCTAGSPECLTHWHFLKKQTHSFTQVKTCFSVLLWSCQRHCIYAPRKIYPGRNWGAVVGLWNQIVLELLTSPQSHVSISPSYFNSQSLAVLRCA